MKNDTGSVTLEASIALTMFMFFILTFLSFGQIYRVQNKVDHAVNQTCQNISIDEFAYSALMDQSGGKAIEELAKSINNIMTVGEALFDTEMPDLSIDIYKSDLERQVKNQFCYFMNDGSYATIEEIKKDNRIKEITFKDIHIGTDDVGPDFTHTYKKNVLFVDVEYTVKPQFAFFAKEVKLRKCVKMKLCKSDKQK